MNELQLYLSDGAKARRRLRRILASPAKEDAHMPAPAISSASRRKGDRGEDSSSPAWRAAASADSARLRIQRVVDASSLGARAALCGREAAEAASGRPGPAVTREVKSYFYIFLDTALPRPCTPAMSLHPRAPADPAQTAGG